MKLRTLSAFNRLSLETRAALSAEVAKGTSFDALVNAALPSMTPLELADYILGFEYLRPKPKGMPKDPILRSVVTLDVARMDGTCMLRVGDIYERYSLRCREEGKSPIYLPWFGRLLRPLMNEIHNEELSCIHIGRVYKNMMLRPIKTKRGGA